MRPPSPPAWPGSSATDRSATCSVTRVVVAVRDGQQVAAYAGRALREHIEPRWLNTLATEAFDKSRVLIGLTEGRSGCPVARTETRTDRLALTRSLNTSG